MTEHEKYQEHIQHTHDVFCKTVIRHAAIDAARSIRSRRKREISLEYLIEEKHYPFSTTDKYFTEQSGMNSYPLFVCGQMVLLESPELAAALSALSRMEQEIIFLYYFQRLTHREIGRRYHPTNYSGVPVISLYASCMGACAASMFFMGTFCFTATNLMRNIGLAIGLLFFFWLLLTSTIIRVLPEILQLFKLSGEVVQDGYLIPFWPSRILYVVCAVALMYWNLHLVNQQPDFNKKRWCKHGNKSM